VPEPIDDGIVATEQWFVRRGLPHFIFRYSASTDVWTRAAPLLALVALAEVVGNAPNTDFPVWVSVLASVVAFAAVLAVWGVANRLRDRPTFARPVDVGPVEVALFVIVPALVPIAAGGQWRSGLVTGGANLALLVLIYITTSYGIVPMTRWAVTHGARQIRAVSGVLTRALPILLLVVIVVFYTQEPFQIAHKLPWALIGLGIGVFFVVGVSFAVIRIPRQVGELADFESWATLRSRATQTPAAALVRGMPARPSAPPKLSRKEWLNVGLVVLATEGILIVLVGLAMFAFLVVLGVITVPGSLMPLWVNGKPDVLTSFHLFGTRLVVTSELLKASAFLAGFTALQFTVSLLSDENYQDEFLHELREELRESLAARAVYLLVSIKAVSIKRARPSG
jgi:hypothetical protein